MFFHIQKKLFYKNDLQRTRLIGELGGIQLVEMEGTIELGQNLQLVIRG